MNDEAQTKETKGTSRQGLFRFLASISSCISGSHSNTAQANYNRLVPAASESQQQLNGVVQRHLPFKDIHRSSSMCQNHCPGNSRNTSVLFYTSSLTVSQIISSGRNGQGSNYTWLRHIPAKTEKLLFEGVSSLKYQVLFINPLKLNGSQIHPLTEKFFLFFSGVPIKITIKSTFL